MSSDIMTIWCGMGRAKAIGVSNYEVRHLQELQQHCVVTPMVNQVHAAAHHVQNLACLTTPVHGTVANNVCSTPAFVLHK